jgi:hypothetical protein
MSQWGAYRDIGGDRFIAHVVSDPFIPLTGDCIIDRVFLVSRSILYEPGSPINRARADYFIGKRYAEWLKLP